MKIQINIHISPDEAAELGETLPEIAEKLQELMQFNLVILEQNSMFIQTREEAQSDLLQKLLFLTLTEIKDLGISIHQ
jgi:hypothetical protein